MPFVRYVLSFLRWNDLLSNRTPLDSVSRPLTCAIMVRMLSACGFYSYPLLSWIYTRR